MAINFQLYELCSFSFVFTPLILQKGIITCKILTQMQTKLLVSYYFHSLTGWFPGKNSNAIYLVFVISKFLFIDNVGGK